MKNYHVNVFFSEEDEGYIADIPDLKYCSAFGETPEEALREVLKAKDAWVESARNSDKLIRERGARSECRGDAPVIAQRYKRSGNMGRDNAHGGAAVGWGTHGSKHR